MSKCFASLHVVADPEAVEVMVVAVEAVVAMEDHRVDMVVAAVMTRVDMEVAQATMEVATIREAMVAREATIKEVDLGSQCREEVDEEARAKGGKRPPALDFLLAKSKTVKLMIAWNKVSGLDCHLT